MKKLILFLFILLSLSMGTSKKIKVVFFGDSITESGVNEGGYLQILKALLSANEKYTEYNLIGAGVSGNKVYDLFLRLEEDVLKLNPDVVVIWIGVNDVWHKQTFGTGTDADKFEFFYTAIINILKEKDIKVILTTPAAIGEKTDFSNQQDGDLNHYSNIIRRLAKQHNCGIVDLRKEFLEYNLKNNSTNKASGILTTDGVHLNGAGNLFVAEKMLHQLIKK